MEENDFNEEDTKIEENSNETGSNFSDNGIVKNSPKLKIKKLMFWKYSAIIAVVLLIISLFTGGFGVKGGTSDGDTTSDITGMVTAESAADAAVDYINNNLLQAGTSAELKEVGETNGVYTVKLNIGGQDYDSYISKDGQMLFTTGVDMTKEIEQPAVQEQAPPPEVPKSDKPEVELFIMSHCPFGTQAMKGMIPAVKALGDTVEFKMKFVYYAMHGGVEVKEQLNQYCIQKEQNEKYLDYLVCFLEEGKGEDCLEEVEIDMDKLKTCVEETDEEFEVTANLEDKEKWLNGRYPKFDIDAEANEEYGVGGSPTLVVNGAQASSSRDSASYLRTICAAFNEAPEECDTEVSSASPSPGFGYETTGAATADAGCGA